MYISSLDFAGAGETGVATGGVDGPGETTDCDSILIINWIAQKNFVFTRGSNTFQIDIHELPRSA